MDPSDVRRVVLADHAKLRKLMPGVYRAIAALGVEGSHGHDAFATRVGELLTELRAHLDTEDRLLVPTLQHIDAWGPVRAERVATEHAAQRLRITELETALADRHIDPDTLAIDVSEFMEELHADMTEEEKHVLSADLLRDDSITDDTIDG
jgi:hypothetical protein